MRVLIACEYSGRVREAFKAKGHHALSCDLLPTDIPGNHYQGDIFDLINWPVGKRFDFGDGSAWFAGGLPGNALGFDLMIAHPPCTYLTCAAEWAYKDVQTKKIKPGTLIGQARRDARDEALAFVELLWNSPIKKVCIENPVGVINSRLSFMPNPQWIQHYQFGEDASKKTGLWLRGLDELIPTSDIHPRMVCGCGHVFSYSLGKYGCPNCCGDFKASPRWANQTNSGQNREPPAVDRWKIRSTTPVGIARAMADQWG